jgi:hypothetical protein
MPRDDGSAESASWPMPKLKFAVDLEPDMNGIGLQEESGIDEEDQIVESE